MRVNPEGRAQPAVHDSHGDVDRPCEDVVCSREHPFLVFLLAGAAGAVVRAAVLGDHLLAQDLLHVVGHVPARLRHGRRVQLLCQLLRGVRPREDDGEEGIALARRIVEPPEGEPRYPLDLRLEAGLDLAQPADDVFQPPELGDENCAGDLVHAVILSDDGTVADLHT